MRFGFHTHHHRGERGGPREDCGPRGGRAAMRDAMRGGGHFRRGPFEFAWSMDGDERERGGGGRRRMFDGGELRLVLLRLIGDQPRHGYDLIRAIEERTGGAYAPSPGVVYPTITMLNDMGLIEEAPSEGKRKLFDATAEGRQELETKAEEIAALMARLDAMGDMRDRSDNTAIRRSVHNLKIVLRQKFGRGDTDQETAHAVVALIDELAQKIERL